MGGAGWEDELPVAVRIIRRVGAVRMEVGAMNPGGVPDTKKSWPGALQAEDTLDIKKS